MINGHTPGPWSFRGCGGGWAIDFNEDQEQVVDFVYEEADARLIAAAPELLEALESAQMAIMGYTHQNAVTLAALFKANAAIAKARGT